MQIKCPNCNVVLEVSNTKNTIFCPECLKNLNKQFVMLETTDCKYNNLGDGFFQKERE